MIDGGGTGYIWVFAQGVDYNYFYVSYFRFTAVFSYKLRSFGVGVFCSVKCVLWFWAGAGVQFVATGAVRYFFVYRAEGQFFGNSVFYFFSGVCRRVFHGHLSFFFHWGTYFWVSLYGLELAIATRVLVTRTACSLMVFVRPDDR